MTADFEKILAAAWPEWNMLEPIHAGEASVVYKAKRKDVTGTSEAAIKVTVIPADLSEIERLRTGGLSDDVIRLHLEQKVREYVGCIRLMGPLKGYTNILGLEDYKVFLNEETGQWFIMVRMELLTPLTKWVQITPFTQEDLIRLGIDICNALDVCNRNHIVHRNIKPENIFVGKGKEFKLGDFTQARNMEQNVQFSGGLGSPNFTAPEVYNAVKSSFDFEMHLRMDIYSLGMVMYYLANNRRLPFVPTDKQIVSPAERREAADRRLRGEKLPGIAHISPRLEEIILKACAYRAEDRYASAVQMRQALLELLPREEQMMQANSCGQPGGDGRIAAGAAAYAMTPSMSKADFDTRCRKKSPFNWLTALLASLLVIMMIICGYLLLNRNGAENDTKDHSAAPQKMQTEEALTPSSQSEDPFFSS